MAEPLIRDNPDESRFEILIGDEIVGVSEYETRPGVRAFTSTEVDDRFQGQGLAGRLIAAALDATRADGLAVEPYCPYVRGYIAKHPAYVDLVPADRRAEFDLDTTPSGA